MESMLTAYHKVVLVEFGAKESRCGISDLLKYNP